MKLIHKSVRSTDWDFTLNDIFEWIKSLVQVTNEWEWISNKKLIITVEVFEKEEND